MCIRDRQKDLLMRAMPIIMPIDKRRSSIRSGFGWRIDPFTRAYRFHQGIDLSLIHIFVRGFLIHHSMANQ